MYDTTKPEYRVLAFWDKQYFDDNKDFDTALLATEPNKDVALIADMYSIATRPHIGLKNVRMCKLYKDKKGNCYIHARHCKLFYLTAYWFGEDEPPFIYPVVG